MQKVIWMINISIAGQEWMAYKKWMLKTAMAVCFIVYIMAALMRVEAAEKWIALNKPEESAVSSQYDGTGDGKKDAIEIKPKITGETNYDAKDWQIKINGKAAYTAKEADYIMASLYPVAKGKVYWIIADCWRDNEDISGFAMYEYKSGVLKKMCDFYNPVAKNIFYYHYGVEIDSVSRGKIAVTCRNQFGGTGWLSWKMVYKYRDGKWRVQGNTYTVSEVRWKPAAGKRMTANRLIPMYKKAGENSISHTVSIGDIVIIKKICIKGKATYIQTVDGQGRTGWFESPKKAEPYFQEVEYTG